MRRALTLDEIGDEHAAGLHARLAATARHWSILRIAPAVVERACGPFPRDPIRTLDALHIASALQLRTALSDLALLSLDDRIRKVGALLGFRLLPK